MSEASPLITRLLLIATRVIRLGKEREGKKFTDIVIERSYELLGCTPDEKSDENMKWMIENGYLKKKTKRYRRGTRGRISKSERQRT